MDNKTQLFEPLLEKVRNYAKTSFELYKLKTINKSVDIVSNSVSRIIAIILFSIFIVTANIGVSLWLGDLLGKSYYGFFCIAGFYGVIGTFVYFVFHKPIKKCVSNSMISQLLN